MQIYELRGSPYEMGVAYGRELAAFGFAPPPASPEKLAFAAACEETVRQWAPEILEELDAMAEAAQCDATLLKAMALTLGEGPGCSVIAISGDYTADGKPLYGRNFDFLNWDAEYQQLYRTYPTTGLASLGGTDIFVGREDGINEAGLAMAQTHVMGRDNRPGVLFSIAGRMVLDRCRTVAEAVALLEAVPHVRANNWLLADAQNTIAVVETSPEHVSARYAEDGFAIATNHFRQPEMLAREAASERPPDSEARLCTLEAWFQQRKGTIGMDDLCAVLSSREEGVCVYHDDAPNSLSTLRSLVASPGERRAWVTPGVPCHTEYNIYEF